MRSKNEIEKLRNIFNELTKIAPALKEEPEEAKPSIDSFLYATKGTLDWVMGVEAIEVTNTLKSIEKLYNKLKAEDVVA